MTRRTWPVVLAGLLSLAIATWYATALAVWLDEGWTLVSTTGSFADTWDKGLFYELQAPLYFPLLALWRDAAGMSITSARILSLLFGAGALLVVAGHVRRWGGERAPWLFALVALHPVFLWKISEARTYPMAILLSVILVRVALALLRVTEPREAWRSLAAFTAISTVLAYTMHTGVLLVMALTGALMVLHWVRGRPRVAAAVFGAAAVAGVACVPLALALPRQIELVRLAAWDGMAPATVREVWNQVAGIIEVNLLGTLLDLSELDATWGPIVRLVVWPARLLVLALLVAAMLRLRQVTSVAGADDRDRDTASMHVMLAITISLYVASYGALSLRLGSDSLGAQHAMPVVAPMAIMLLTAIPAAWHTRRIRVAEGAVIVMLVVNLAGGLWLRYSRPWRQFDMRATAHDIDATVDATTPLLVYRGEYVHALRAELRQPKHIIGLPVDAARTDIRIPGTQDEATARRDGAPLAAVPEFWELLVPYADVVSEMQGEQFLRTVRPAHCRLVSSRVLSAGPLLRRWSCTPPVPAAAPATP